MDLETITSRLASSEERALQLADERHKSFKALLDQQREFYWSEEKPAGLAVRAFSGLPRPSPL